MDIETRNNNHEIFAPLKDKWLVNKPEEQVRQKYICRLVDSYGFRLSLARSCPKNIVTIPEPTREPSISPITAKSWMIFGKNGKMLNY